MTIRRRGTTLSITTIFGLLALFGFATASAWYPPEVPVPQDEREFTVDETLLPFEALPGAPAQQLWGVRKGAGYRIEVPEGWDGGDLMMYAHGFRGNIPELTVDSPPEAMRRWLLANGIAWAASSYSRNYYDVRSGVESTNDLARFFKRKVGRPDRTFITGFSMGGHVTGAAIEMYPNVNCPDGRRGRFCRRIVRVLGKLSGGIRYSGAAPFCGVMGDTELLNYFGDVNRGAEALAGVQLPAFPPPEDYFTTIFPQVLLGFANPEVAARHVALTQMLSGGPRPGFAASYAFWQEFLFGFAGGDSTFDGIISGELYDNIGRVYQLDPDPALTDVEQALNDQVFRTAADPGVNPRRFLKLQRIPEISGRLTQPVVSTHTFGDLFVPFSMEQIYAREAQQKHRDHLLVSRATRAVGHCEFSGSELVAGVADMIQWATDGQRPGGDDILDVEALAAPDAGCAHSITDRPFGPEGPAFPASRAAYGACPGD
ncbi:MAG: alpha/beta hydrolase [Pseudomonadota bacterium]